MKKTSVKACKVVVPMAGGFNETGRIFVIGQSNARKLVHFMKTSMNIKDVEYNKTKVPLTDYKMKTLTDYLERSKLRKNET